ncbi:MAG: nucleotide exchange factor GrpE [Buchnera aphidicola (Meitanaphis elongallis)]
MNHENQNLNSINNNDTNIQNEKKHKENNCFSNINPLNEQILNIKKNIIDIKLREQAEIENIKKKADLKIKEIEKTQLQHFCVHLIPILDNLKNIGKTIHKLNVKHNKIVEGISLTLKSLLHTIQKFDLVIENKKNIKFNSFLHQTEPNEQLDNVNTYYVTSIIKDGYICQGKIIRKATVRVKKKL